MTEADARAVLAAFDSFDGLETWIAEQRWLLVPGGWVVLEQRQGCRFRVQIVPGGIRVSAFEGDADPAAWVVPSRAKGAPLP